MRFLGNLLWCLLGGLVSALSWALAGAFCMVLLACAASVYRGYYEGLGIVPAA